MAVRRPSIKPRFLKLFGSLHESLAYGYCLSDPEIVRTYLPYLDHVEQHIGSVVEVWGGQEIPPWKIVTPQVYCYDVLSKFGRSPDIGPYYNSKTPIGSVPTFTVGPRCDERPRARCVEAGGLRQMSSTVRRFWSSSDQAEAWTVLLAG